MKEKKPKGYYASQEEKINPGLENLKKNVKIIS